jgi:hypothetical protein
VTSEITIPAADMSAIVQRAILDSLSSDTKETMIATALAAIMDKPVSDTYDHHTRSYPKKDSMLETAFKNAMRVVVDEVARELVAEMKPKIAASLRPMVEAVGAADGYPVDEELYSTLFAAILSWSKEQEARRRGY